MSLLSRSCGAAALAALACLEPAAALRKSAGSKRGHADASSLLNGVPLYRHTQGPAAEDQDGAAAANGWMVAFGPDATDATLEAYCEQSGPCTSIGHPSKGGIPFVTVAASEAALSASIDTHRAHIAFIEQDAEAVDFKVSSLDASVSSKGDGPWFLSAINRPRARSAGKGVNVYVLDSGVRVTHKQFGGRAIPLYDARARPPKVCDPTDRTCARDRRGHGTHVAGTVGAQKWGVAPEATIMVMNRGSTLADGYSCMDWLVQHRKRPAVLQLSWGIYEPSEVARAAVDATVAAGIVVVAGAGNNKKEACGFTFAMVPNAITVAASDIKFKRSSFSNFGECVDIFAPGTSINSLDYESDTDLKRLSGTSMAGPFVAGASALLLSLHPDWSPAQVRAELRRTAKVNAIEDAKQEPNYFLQVGPDRTNETETVG